VPTEGLPIAFHSRKVKTCCKDPLCSTTERILLSIVEVLKKFRNILLDQKDQRLPQYLKERTMLLLMLSADLIWEEPKNLKKHLSQRRDAPTGMGIPKEDKTYDRQPLSFQ
jgi:hypothetical protein